MRIVNTVSQLRAVVAEWRRAGERVALVPTMGNLHDGHLALVHRAKTEADRVVVSIFVNPTQFAPGEDFDTYPRTEQGDAEKLASAQADLLFLPAVAEVYASDAKTWVSVAGISELYCGAFRPGHFNGVATVVCKLFNMVGPDCAVFGLKDFQQLAIIRAMVRDLHLPIEIIGVDTVREPSGLAMSSRNGYLSAEEKAVAPLLYRCLREASADIVAGCRDYAAVERKALDFLRQSGFQPDYFSVCRDSDLAKAEPMDVELVLLVAAKLGRTRLIDNLRVSLAAV